MKPEFVDAAKQMTEEEVCLPWKVQEWSYTFSIL